MKKKHLLERIEALQCQVDQLESMNTFIYQRIQGLEDKCKKQQYDITALLYRFST